MERHITDLIKKVFIAFMISVDDLLVFNLFNLSSVDIS